MERGHKQTFLSYVISLVYINYLSLALLSRNHVIECARQDEKTRDHHHMIIVNRESERKSGSKH